jgi:hypothetical protein
MATLTRVACVVVFVMDVPLNSGPSDLVLIAIPNLDLMALELNIAQSHVGVGFKSNKTGPVPEHVSKIILSCPNEEKIYLSALSVKQNLHKTSPEPELVSTKVSNQQIYLSAFSHSTSSIDGLGVLTTRT